ncbi:hypothetical protein ACM01_34530 [Streptomyces viridochromogenes]|uniref:Uncharacterized protein n=1 Tax=Streptomyces viridochromogenes TaxID=1938 RepID=A0A0J7Z1T8_STRVR|nr:hypothetical protein [Streptomyces viridochromogenes]KMS69582.1 hypothetical protein ACM01_34530 [Streptomyces viridochromogenes]
MIAALLTCADSGGGKRRGGAGEAEIIRQGIHLAPMANRVCDEPLFSRTFEGAGRTPSKAEVRDAVADAVRRDTDSGTSE